jgi:hypothetical protein
MATFYVSKTNGNDSNDGTTKATAVATLPKAFDLFAGAGGGGHTIEIIDNGSYHPSGSSSPWLPGMNQSSNGNSATSAATWANLTLKAGTDSNGNQVYPVLDGRDTSASTASYGQQCSNTGGTLAVGDAIQYFAGWTIEGLEFRGFKEKAARPHASMTTATLIFRNCIVHDMPMRSPEHTGVGSDEGCVSYLAADTGGDLSSNIVENCIFYNIPKAVIGGAPDTAVHIKNCLIFNYGGSNGTSANKVAINLNHADSIVEHCIISDYQGGRSSAHIPGVNMGANNQGTVKNCIFNNISTNHYVIEANRSISNVFINIDGSPDGMSDAAGSRTNEEEGGAELIQWNSSSTAAGTFDINNGLPNRFAAVAADIEETGRVLANSGYPAYAYTDRSSLGVDQASGSTSTVDLSTAFGRIKKVHNYSGDRVRTSTAAGCNADIGCYEFFRDWSDSNGVTNPNIGDDFTINDGASDQLDNQYRVKLNDKECAGQHRAPFSKTIKGVANLRTLKRNSPYKVTKGS